MKNNVVFQGITLPEVASFARARRLPTLQGLVQAPRGAVLLQSVLAKPKTTTEEKK